MRERLATYLEVRYAEEHVDRAPERIRQLARPPPAAAPLRAAPRRAVTRTLRRRRWATEAPFHVLCLKVIIR